jgi:hypothetical protein
MERYIEYVLVAIIVLFATFVITAKAETVQELYLDLEDTGVVIIKNEPCKIQKAIDLGLHHRAVGVEGNGVTHEGCWNSPDISQAQQVPNTKIIPIVNLFFDGMVQTVPITWFRPKSSSDNPAPGETWI